MKQIINKITNWFKATWYNVQEQVCIGIVVIAFYAVLTFGAMTIINSIVERREAKETFKLELVGIVKSIQTTLECNDNKQVFNDITATFDRIEQKLDKLNSRPIYKPVTNIVYNTTVDTRLVDTPKETAKQLTINVDSLLSCKIDSLNKVIDDQNIRLLAYSDTVKTYRGIVADRIAENKQLTKDNIRHKRSARLFQGLTVGEAVYIGFKTLEANKK